MCNGQMGKLMLVTGKFTVMGKTAHILLRKEYKSIVPSLKGDLEIRIVYNSIHI